MTDLFFAVSLKLWGLGLRWYFVSTVPWSVGCMFICLSGRIFRKPHIQTSPNSVRTARGRVRSSSGNVTTSGFVNDVMLANNLPGKGDASRASTQSDSPWAAPKSDAYDCLDISLSFRLFVCRLKSSTVWVFQRRAVSSITPQWSLPSWSCSRHRSDSCKFHRWRQRKLNSPTRLFLAEVRRLPQPLNQCRVSHHCCTPLLTSPTRVGPMHPLRRDAHRNYHRRRIWRLRHHISDTGLLSLVRR